MLFLNIRISTYLWCLGVESPDKPRLFQKGPVLSKDFQGGLSLEQNNDHVQNSTVEKADKVEILVEDGEEQQETIEEEVEEEEIRKRRYSPRMTLPVQKKEEKKKRPDEAEGATRRVSPKFQGGVGKVSQKAEDEKMYLFDLI